MKLSAADPKRSPICGLPQARVQKRRSIHDRGCLSVIAPERGASHVVRNARTCRCQSCLSKSAARNQQVSSGDRRAPATKPSLTRRVETISLPLRVAADHCIRDCWKNLVGAFATLDLWLTADARNPLVVERIERVTRHSVLELSHRCGKISSLPRKPLRNMGIFSAGDGFTMTAAYDGSWNDRS